MPPSLPYPPHPDDPGYQRLERRVNFLLHLMVFAAVNSGLWFFVLLQRSDWLGWRWLTISWATVLLSHALWVLSKRKS
ncbi:MAG: 2TM domain-containing protein [Pseudanabaenaceae cyanobacterium SKYGB_i_bin29]|nr:2TM domain-containing protein [Pseudanabaenaceae cyanobacterium SKYG29]MDW8422435.1 2TM domain-containing protein [Pseudanabaenaceae cyanobacterium SKYGB_i_bin29]